MKTVSVVFFILLTVIAFASENEFHDKIAKELKTLKIANPEGGTCKAEQYSNGKELKKKHCPNNIKCLLEDNRMYYIKNLYSSPDEKSSVVGQILFRKDMNDNGLDLTWVGSATSENYIVPNSFSEEQRQHYLPLAIIWEEKNVDRVKWIRLPNINKTQPVWYNFTTKDNCLMSLDDRLVKKSKENFNASVVDLKLNKKSNYQLTLNDKKIENEKIKSHFQDTFGISDDAVSMLIVNLRFGYLHFKIPYFGKDRICDDDTRKDFDEDLKHGTTFKIELRNVTTADGFLRKEYMIPEFTLACLVDIKKMSNVK